MTDPATDPSDYPDGFFDRPYRPCVGMALFNHDGLVFAGKRIDSRLDAWQMPQGGIDDGEDAPTAAMRELLEEVGTQKAEIIGELDNWLSYDLPADLANTVWKGRYRGQKQRWFALRFTGTDSDINIATDHQEFSEWAWKPLAAMPDLIVPFKRDLYQQVAAAFSEFADGPLRS